MQPSLTLRAIIPFREKTMPAARIVVIEDEQPIRRGAGAGVRGAARPGAGRGPPGVRGARLGRAVIDFARREVCWSDERGQPQARAELSETESAILSFLVAHKQRAVSREELLTGVWG